MRIKVAWSLLTLVFVVGAALTYTRSASSSSPDRHAATPRVVPRNFNLLLPFATTLDVDRSDDTASATACTNAPNDCSLRGAVINANAAPGALPVTINLQPSTTYNLTLTNAAQENAASTGDLDINTTLHPVTIVGGGSAGPGASIIDASGLNVGTAHDRAFQITGPGVAVTFQDLVIQNGQAADDGGSGASTNPAAQNSTRAGGCILNGAGIDVNGVAINGGGTVSLTNVTLQSCQVLGKGDSQVNQPNALEALGGGLASIGATGNVNIAGSTLTSNSALGGDGGNFNNGNAGAAKGGSIYFTGVALNISGSKITSSHATGGEGGDGPGNQQNGGGGGRAHGGGAYAGTGTVTINNSTFESCAATGGNAGTGQNGGNFGGEAGGGGLYSFANTTVTNSTFDSNTATGGRGGDAFGPDCFGGHIALDGGAARGGAILADNGSLTVNTATFANNSVKGGDGGDGGKTNGGTCSGSQHGAGGVAQGGAITNQNMGTTVNIKHGTISGNSAQAGNSGVNQPGVSLPARPVAEGTGGGIRVGPGAATLENTIIANNTAANGTGDATGAPVPGPDVDGNVTSNGHNLVGNATEATGFTGTGDLTGVNPSLMALADNGGPTQTMALSPGSPAIDAGVAAGASFDQRGRPRTYNDPGVADAATSDGTDIGAFELQPLCSLACPGDVEVSNDPNECGAVVEYTEPAGAGCGTVTCDHPSGSFFGVGETTVTCTSTAGPSCSFTVTVNDTQAPKITTGGSVTLWPPNHKYQTFSVNDLVAGAVDNCDAGVGVGGVRIKKVTSDELENSGGDGSTLNDIVVAADCKSLKLRAERVGGGNGRVYTITLKVADASGNVGTATATVTVPNSQNGAAAVDDGPHYTVLSNCP
ncbi:MAG: hypothetical protein JOZ96_18090 [Acidobacteria bacterium]|nr:hypothetical protein [Acidobacteriota bacterium]